MSFLDALFGRGKPVKSRLDRLFAIATAYVTLTVDLNLKPSGRAGITFRPVTSSAFESLEKELERLLELTERETGSRVRTVRDRYGFQWVVLEDEDFEDLVATLHLVSLTLEDSGFGEQLLAAVFKFLEGSRPVYWIYNYKRGTFYPEVPSSEVTRQRDHAAELRLRAVMERELPIEPELQRWYPLWGVPV